MKKKSALRCISALLVIMLVGFSATGASIEETVKQKSIDERGLTTLDYSKRTTVSELEGYNVLDFVSETGVQFGTLDPLRSSKLKALGDDGLYSFTSMTNWLQFLLKDFVLLSKNKVVIEETTQVSEVMEEDTYVEEDVEEPEEEYEEPAIEEEVEYESDTGAADETAPVTTGSPAEQESEEKSETKFSTTNTQEQEVDEADIIKTDGKYIYYYSASKKTVAIVQVDGDTMKQVSKITIDNAVSSSTAKEEMFLLGDQLILIYQSGADYWTNVCQYDLSDPTKPKLARTVSLDGNYVSSRLANGTVYLTTNDYFLYDSYSQKPISDVLPKYRDSVLGKETYVVWPKDIYAQKDNDSENTNYPTFYYTTVSAFEVRKQYPVDVQVFLGDAGEIYMTAQSLYLNIEASKETTLHRFALNRSKVNYAASGKVNGLVLNQYSMSEYQGYFRIATTTNRDSWYNATNQLYVLDMTTMDSVGSVEGIAPNENIKSVRMRGNTAYVVTFKNVDPLFVIDLSDPQNPKIVGELKIPGFSNYLHPYKDNYVIGIGRETEQDMDTGSYIDLGLKLSLFDVSDPQNPTEVTKIVIGENTSTYSAATSNPRSIMTDLDKGILAIPITFNDETSYYRNKEEDSWTGGIVIQLENNEFSIAKEVQLPSDTKYEQSEGRFCYINNTLYFVNQNRLIAMNYTTYEQLGTLKISF